jgi:hypothetical protein
MLKSLLLAGVAAAFFSVTGAAPAQATVLDFDLAVSNGDDSTWTLPSAPVPIFYDTTITRIDTSFTGTYSGLPFVTFAAGGGVTASFGTDEFNGPQIFGGTTAAPTFAPGVFDLTGSFGDVVGDTAVLTITDPAAVPEAATWAMMLVGLGGIGSVARRRQNVRVAYG